MIARVLPVLLLLAAAPAPETDPFLAALAGKSGPDAVAAPAFDPGTNDDGWTSRPRREILEGMAARLLRGEGKGWFEKVAGPPVPVMSRDLPPEDVEPAKVEIADRLAARVPAGVAAVFFGSLDDAERAVDELSVFLPRALPDLCADDPGFRRDPLSRALGELLIPTIWRSNPGVRRGTRQAAILAADPDLWWNPEVALVVEVDDASLVRFHRLSTLSFEDRGPRRLRIEGLDALSDDGSVRSFFGLEGGIAVWSNGRAFRDRILAAAAGKAPTLLAPDARAYASARHAFPASGGGPLLVVPDGFIGRGASRSVLDRRTAALRCDAVRMVLAARALAKVVTPLAEGVRLACPSGGTIRIAPGSVEASCTVHGSIRHRVPIGDLPDASMAMPGSEEAPNVRGSLWIAASWRNGRLDVLIPPIPFGESRPGSPPPYLPSCYPWYIGARKGEEGKGRVARRLDRIREAGVTEEKAVSVYESIFGETPAPSEPGSTAKTWRTEDGILHVTLEAR